LHESRILAASPDGIVQSSHTQPLTVHYQTDDVICFEPDIIEVKCPYSARDMTVEEFAISQTRNCFLGNYWAYFY
jgi:hypothetical protein